MPKGSSKHKLLMDFAKREMDKRGISVLAYDAELESGAQVDILGVKEGKTVGVECYRQVQPKIVKRRLEKLHGLDEVVFCVPDEVEAQKLYGLGFKGDVWVANLDIGYTNIKVPRSIVRKLNELRKEGETLAQVIERIIQKV
jgi:hypothetical protein